MGYLADWSDRRPAQMHEICEATGVPMEYLRKLLGRLVRAELIESLRGRRGGYRLGRDASQITLLQIVEAVEGPILEQNVIEEDLLGMPSRQQASRLRRVRKQVSSDLRDSLKQVSLAQIADAA